MNTTKLVVAFAVAMISVCTAFAGRPSGKGAPKPSTKPTIVLVHGAWADGTSWQHVIPLLERDGYTVIAVQNPLTSFADDLSTTKRVLDGVKGPIVVVGHSYGGAVITAAAAGNSNVKALVYLAAFAPNSGERVGELLEKYAPTALGTAVVPDAAGYLFIDPAKFRNVFAKDVPESEARVMAAAQKPINNTAFGGLVETAAWKTIPSWYLISLEDQAINPDLQRFLAKRMGATTTEIKASHAAYVSHGDVVAALIRQAATSTSR